MSTNDDCLTNIAHNIHKTLRSGIVLEFVDEYLKRKTKLDMLEGSLEIVNQLILLTLCKS